MEEEAGVAKGKERRVTFRMEGGDYDALCERCERAGLSKSEYLRYLVRIPLSTEANAGDEHRILVDVSVNIFFTIFTNVFSPIAPTRMRRIRQRGCAAFGV